MAKGNRGFGSSLTEGLDDEIDVAIGKHYGEP